MIFRDGDLQPSDVKPVLAGLFEVMAEATGAVCLGLMRFSKNEHGDKLKKLQLI